MLTAGGNILGISAFYHDSSACLLQDGNVVAAAQEERFTRRKFDAGFPTHSVRYCLRQAELEINDIDLVVFYENPAVKFNRIVDTFVHNTGCDAGHRDDVLRLWSKSKLWQKETIRERLGFDGQILFPLHHQTHAASAFFPSPYTSAAIVTMDGVGEWMTSTIGQGEGNSLALIKNLDFPHSLGMFYSAFTQFTGFRVNSGEYKLMGLAPYGSPRYAALIRERLVDIRDDGSFRLDMTYFDFAAGKSMVNEAFCGLFGRPPRKPEAPLTQDDMDLARSAQEVAEEIMLKVARHARKVTGEKFLCLAGGVALNCVANARIQSEAGFQDIWIQPAAGDAGGSLGAAWFGWHVYLGMPRAASPGDRQDGSLLGPAFDNTEIAAQLRSAGAVFDMLPEDELIDAAASRLAGGKVVGHFHGRMEFGPRALGNRSILADPRAHEMQKRMNLKIKFRESFRPFAPSVLEDRAREFFDLPSASPYMLLTATVAASQRLPLSEEDRARQGLDQLGVRRSSIPAITHVDGSARVQTVSRAGNRRFYDLLQSFEQKTGCPVLVNTSFNVRSEPIVCTPLDAYSCFMSTGMDSLAIGNCLLDKDAQPAWTNPSPRRAEDD